MKPPPDKSAALPEPVAWIWEYRDSKVRSLRWEADQLDWGNNDVSSKSTPLCLQSDLTAALAQIEALKKDAQEGYCIVPLVPTQQMFEAGFNAMDKQYHGEPMDDYVEKVHAVYKAMIDARKP